MDKYTFKATMYSWRVDQDGEAKLTLSIPKEEVKQMAELSQFNNILFQVAIVIIPE